VRLGAAIEDLVALADGRAHHLEMHVQPTSNTPCCGTHTEDLMEPQPALD